MDLLFVAVHGHRVTPGLALSFVEMSSKGLLFLNTESAVCAPDLLTPRIS